MNMSYCWFCFPKTLFFFPQRLEPLGVPTLTAEQLAEKQRQADEKRDEVLNRYLNSYC